ncbi:MAG: hypothetical protein IKO68_06605 [Oscillospiraceae bacterium]|nr:hypothetical protein [Oscillospiraceae bacterium]
MKIKKNIEDLKKEQENVSDVMQELSDDVMDQVSGAGNPFADIPRADNQSIDSDLRSNG